MKSLLGGGALVLVMAAGAWSSDAVSGPDRPDRPGRHQQEQADRKADRRADKADKADKAEKTADGEKPPHPHGEPPGLAQRERQGPPPWSGGPENRSEEPPGLAKQDRSPEAG